MDYVIWDSTKFASENAEQNAVQNSNYLRVMLFMLKQSWGEMESYVRMQRKEWEKVCSLKLHCPTNQSNGQMAKQNMVNFYGFMLTMLKQS